MNMTPQQIWDYKMKWLPGHAVSIHSDLSDHIARHIVTQQLPPHKWHYKKWTNVYEHSYLFESEQDANIFESTIKNYYGL